MLACLFASLMFRRPVNPLPSTVTTSALAHIPIKNEQTTVFWQVVVKASKGQFFNFVCLKSLKTTIAKKAKARKNAHEELPKTSRAVNERFRC